MQAESNMTTPEQRRKNVLTALFLAAFVALVFVLSIPFWKGLYILATSGGG